MPRQLALAWMAVMLGVMASTSALSAERDPSQWAGDWLAPAEDADDVDAVITLSVDKGVWQGQIKAIKVTRPDQKRQDNTPCHACPGRLHEHVLKGLALIWGLHEVDGALQSGQILDPGDGAVYNCEIHLSSDGKRLEVLAYKGMRWMGHAMTWVRP